MADRQRRPDEPWLARKAHALYAPLLERALRHPRTVTLGALIILAAALATFPFLGRSFMPTLDEGDLIVQLEKLPSIGLAETTRTDLAVQRALMKAVPEVRGVVARVGSDELGLDPMGLNQTDTFMQLAPREAWRDPDKERLMDTIRAELQRFAGVSFAFTQPIEMRVSEMLSGTRGDLALKIFGPDLATLSQLAERSVQILQSVGGAEDVLTVRNDGVEYLRVDVDRAMLGRLGMTAQDVQDDLRALVEGRQLGVVQEQGRRFPVLLRAGDGNRDERADEPEHLRSDEHRQDDPQRVQPHREAVDHRLEDVVLDLLVDDQEDYGGHPDRPALEERDHDVRDATERRPHQRDERCQAGPERQQRRERHADHRQEDVRRQAAGGGHQEHAHHVSRDHAVHAVGHAFQRARVSPPPWLTSQPRTWRPYRLRRKVMTAMLMSATRPFTTRWAMSTAVSGPAIPSSPLVTSSSSRSSRLYSSSRSCTSFDSCNWLTYPGTSSPSC